MELVVGCMHMPSKVSKVEEGGLTVGGQYYSPIL